MPTKKGFLLLGLISAILFIEELISPSYSSPKGRLSLIFAPIWNEFGWTGIATFWALCSVISLFFWWMKGE